MATITAMKSAVAVMPTPAIVISAWNQSVFPPIGGKRTRSAGIFRRGFGVIPSAFQRFVQLHEPAAVLVGLRRSRGNLVRSRLERYGDGVSRNARSPYLKPASPV
jgi:hypothetical protein